MKNILLVFLIGLIPSSVDNYEIIKEYTGGRRGYWYHQLKLYDNLGYSYSYWVHTRYSLRDTGNYELHDEKIILNSFFTTVKQGGLSRKQKKKFDSRFKKYKHFENKSFRLDSGKIYLSELTELKDFGDSIEFSMGILLELPKSVK
jgi:hypothetical protein